MAEDFGPPSPTGMDREQEADHRLILGDCLDPVTGLASLPDKSVAHTICDPPFASEIYERCKKNPARNSGAGRGNKPHNSYSVGLKALTEGAIGTLDDVIAGAAKEIARITARWAIVFCDVESVHLWRAALELAGMKHIRVGAWTKPDAMPQFSGDRPAQGFEVCEIAYASGTRPRWNGGGMPAVWHHEISKGHARPDHPCPKPLPLMVDLIRDFTDVGELVCDPFSGSGTTLVAAKMLGRKAIGWERDPKFHGDAVLRLANTDPLFGLLAPVQSGLFPKESARPKAESSLAVSPQAKKALP